MGGFGTKSNYATEWRVILAKTKVYILLIFMEGLKIRLIGVKISKRGERKKGVIRLILRWKKCTLLPP